MEHSYDAAQSSQRETTRTLAARMRWISTRIARLCYNTPRRASPQWDPGATLAPIKRPRRLPTSHGRGDPRGTEPARAGHHHGQRRETLETMRPSWPRQISMRRPIRTRLTNCCRTLPVVDCLRHGRGGAASGYRGRQRGVCLCRHHRRGGLQCCQGHAERTFAKTVAATRLISLQTSPTPTRILRKRETTLPTMRGQVPFEAMLTFSTTKTWPISTA